VSFAYADGKATPLARRRAVTGCPVVAGRAGGAGASGVPSSRSSGPHQLGVHLGGQYSTVCWSRELATAVSAAAACCLCCCSVVCAVPLLLVLCFCAWSHWEISNWSLRTEGTCNNGQQGDTLHPASNPLSPFSVWFPPRVLLSSILHVQQLYVRSKGC
jgi:hypothetical protein